MIGFMPSIYPDELEYSHMARYYAHSGHSAYIFAVEDLMLRKNIKPNIEFNSRLNPEVEKVISKMIPAKDRILNHTMFPFYRFAENARLKDALERMSMGEDVYCLLPVSKGGTISRIHDMRYCPLCAVEARKKYGEAYWTREANIKNINICVKHKCRLKHTGIEISGKKSPRLYIAEEEICDISYDPVDTEGLEFKFAKYMLEVFYKPINFQNPITAGDFLKSKLEGTKYLSARGMQMQISLLFDEIKDFYEVLGEQDIYKTCSPVYCGINQLHQLQHIIAGRSSDFYKVCQVAYFLGISPEDLTNPKLPKVTQTQLYNQKVAQLYSQGLGCHRIARQVGGCVSTVLHANRVKEKKPHDYAAARLGKQAMDWAKLDQEMLPEVQKAINQIYAPKDGRPKRVTENAVTKFLGWPNRRMDYLQKCKELVHSYFEEYPVYWAREVAWSYQYLVDTIGEDAIYWRNIRDITNLSRENFLASYEYLHLFVDEDTEKRIKALLA